jgi:hypothetical protein
MNPPWGSGSVGAVEHEVGELGGVAQSGSGGTALEAMIEFLRRTHLCRLEEEERESLLRAMFERDILCYMRKLGWWKTPCCKDMVSCF